MTAGFPWNARLCAYYDLIFVYLPREPDDQRAWAMVLAFFGSTGLPNSYKPTCKWETHLRRLRNLGAGKLTLGFELAPDTDTLHFHVHFYGDRPKDGCVHGTIMMLAQPSSDSPKGWVDKTINPSAYLNYICGDEKLGKFKGFLEWGEDPESDAVVSANNPNPPNRNETGKDFQQIFSDICEGKVRSMRDIAIAFGNGNIEKVSQIEKSMRGGILSAAIDLYAEGELKAIAGEERIFVTVHGKAGVGKDRWAKYYFARKWIEQHVPCTCNQNCDCWLAHVFVKAGETKWWANYHDQPVVIFSDWQCAAPGEVDPMKWTYHESLTITDRIDPTYSVQIKGSDILYKAQVIIFTMNSSLDQAMPMSDTGRNSWDQLRRRINWAVWITSEPHADPSDWRYRTEFYNKPTARDERNLTKDGIVQMVTLIPEHDYKNAEGEIVAQTTMLEDLVGYSAAKPRTASQPMDISQVSSAPEFQELESIPEESDSDDGVSIIDMTRAHSCVSPTIFEIDASIRENTLLAGPPNVFAERRDHLLATRDKAKALMAKKRKRD